MSKLDRSLDTIRRAYSNRSRSSVVIVLTNNIVLDLMIGPASRCCHSVDRMLFVTNAGIRSRRCSRDTPQCLAAASTIAMESVPDDTHLLDLIKHGHASRDFGYLSMPPQGSANDRLIMPRRFGPESPIPTFLSFPRLPQYGEACQLVVSATIRPPDRRTFGKVRLNAKL